MRKIITAFMLLLCAVCMASAANYLTFTAEEDGSTFGIVNYEGNNPDVQYSLDGGETWAALAGGDTVTLAHKGDKALLKGNNSEGFSKNYDHYSAFKMTGKVAASGSVMSLVDGLGVTTAIHNEGCFSYLFFDCSALTQAPELPATTLAERCYEGMFFGCSSLTQAPELPATTLAEGCYEEMFSGCTSLTQAPELPATTLADRCYFEMFRVCTSLTQAPELPATTLAEGCYALMFSGCTSLTQAPELPATTLPATSDAESGCYYGMFSDCNSLTQAPALPATTLAESCYGHMFLRCTNLTQAPELPATTLANFCYEGMFNGCTSLTQAPALPATTLAEGCYAAMFSNCTSLTQAPALPATTLAGHCYANMFLSCTSLTQAPELPATTLAESCYFNMFMGCTRLSEINVSFDDWAFDMGTHSWVYGVARTGTFICPKALALEYGEDRIPEGWTVQYIDDTVAVETNYLTFTAEEDGSSFGIVNNEGNNPDVQYSLDGGETWTALAAGDTITLAHKGDKALLRGDNPDGFSRFLSPWTMYTSFTMTGKIAASGSVMSLIDGIGETLVIPNDFCFYKLFFGCASLTEAPELPAAILRESCYWEMFVGCTSLTEAPELPATTLTYRCYREMFSGCTSLTQAPELPATTLATSCYYFMFDGCTGLTEAPELPATTLAGYCYCGMFSGCTGLTQAPVLPATTLAGYCYWRMFQDCASLTQAPELPATTLAEGCCASMFSGCTSLTQAPELPATTLADDCYSFMFSGCTGLAQAPELPATTMAVHCYEYMFYGCTSLTKAPELPATELPDSLFMRSGCCESMFSGCTNLSEISIAFDKWNDNTRNWVENVAPTGTFICPKDLPLEHGEDRIPEGWTVQYIDDTVAVEANYLTFTAEEDGSSFGIVNNGSNNPDVQYSLDGGATWIALAEGDTVILAHKGDKALLKGNNPEGFSKSWEQYSTFKMTGKVAASGSVMSLIDGVGLSTEISKSFCFYRLFSGCTSLTQAPELPAKTLAYYCYNSMFEGCTSLTQAPELPATEMTFYCYNRMFSGCTSLTQAPELPATTLFENCYSGMFSGCTSLTRAPELPAIKMFSYCYSGMFSGCTSLTQAPELPAKEFLGKYSYSGMFSGCTSLSEINVSFDDWDKFDATFEWVADVAPTGTFICPKTLALEYGISRIPEGWTVKYIEDMANYLTFTAEEDGSSFGIVNNGGNNPDVQYSLDGGETWNILAEGDSVILVHKGDKALLRGDNPEGFSKSWEQYSTFKMTGKVAASGSVMSLIDGVGISTKIPSDFCFYELFYNCTSLTQAPELPATTLTDWCYQGMFGGCTSLTQAPELPATTLPTGSDMEGGCYRVMFYGCTSLTQAPELPATTLSDNCYFRMFYGCTKLSEIHVSFDDWDYYWATVEWVKDVAPTGTFICPKALALEYGVDRIPEGWTVKYIEDGSGVNSTLADGITVWTDDLTIFVRGAEGKVSLYDMTGKRVAVSNSKAEERALCVPDKGAYVVRTNGGEKSVLVR